MLNITPLSTSRLPSAPYPLVGVDSGAPELPHSVNVPRPALQVRPLTEVTPQPVAEASPYVAFSTLRFPSGKVDASKYIVRGTNRRKWLSFILVLCALVSSVVGTMGIAPVVSLVVGALMRRRAYAQLRGSGVRVGVRQFPEIHRLVTQFARRLDLHEAPEVYIVEAAQKNAFVAAFARRHVVVLTDDVVWGALHSGSPKTLGFVLAHELAHMALGHTRFFRRAQAQLLPTLSRHDELSADAVAAALVDDRQVAIRALALLTVGPQLLPHVDLKALEQQAVEVDFDHASSAAEWGHTHPLLLRRISFIVNDSYLRYGRQFARPR